MLATAALWLAAAQGLDKPITILMKPTTARNALLQLSERTGVALAVQQRLANEIVELDVRNTDGLLAPGMYPSVLWPVASSRAALLVPPTSIVTTNATVTIVQACLTSMRQ